MSKMQGGYMFDEKKAKEVAESVKETMGNAGQTVKDSAHSACDTIQDAKNMLSGKLRQGGDGN
ncbi:hypothetical protein NECAME_16703 [Necator americanus]|uniref:Uncharacterized protein n=1 Tax=Necator americanus TaxID=51031 RepID=W2TU82_NECAM|nr:hypothetical protein NECAME_16703 [Necator americanus]ETN85650.1 hypothetical protein NECAME_16703 [Necator americanus]